MRSFKLRISIRKPSNDLLDGPVDSISKHNFSVVTATHLFY